jgi:uncharacterized protein VirK/YbjX
MSAGYWLQFTMTPNTNINKYMERKKVNSTVAQSPEVVGECMLLHSNATFNPFHDEWSFRLKCLKFDLLYQEMILQISSALPNPKQIRRIRIQYPKIHTVHHSLYLKY